MLKGGINDILLTENIAKYTQKECEQVAMILSKKAIKFNKIDFKLTGFMRMNFQFFENKLSQYTDRKIDFIYRFLLSNGMDITKESINTIYNRLKNEDKKP